MKKLVFLFLFIFSLFPIKENSFATELVWQPINPSFGGSPWNGSWLLQSAQVQNRFKEKSKTWREKTSVERFQESLERSLLYRLSRKIADKAFGEEDLESGHYDIGGVSIDIDVGGENINVTIFDPVTGDTTTIQVPYY